MKYCAVFLLLFAIGFTSACSEHVGSVPPDMRTQGDRIKEFWQWFKTNKTLLETMTDDTYTERLNLVIAHLNPISNGLAVEVSKELHGVRDIIISTEGDRSKFQVVKDITASAPKIQGWTVTAFRQKAEKDFVLQYGELKYNPAKMFFRPVVEGDTLDLIIYADSLKGKDVNDVTHYGLVTMDNVLGEYDCITKVRYYDFRDLSEVENKSQLMRVTSLPTYIERFHKYKTVKN